MAQEKKKKEKDPGRVYGRVKVVQGFADYKVRIVYEEEADLQIVRVKEFPNTRGRWMMVKDLSDYTIQYVNKDEDFTVDFVDEKGVAAKKKYLAEKAAAENAQRNGTLPPASSATPETSAPQEQPPVEATPPGEIKVERPPAQAPRPRRNQRRSGTDDPYTDVPSESPAAPSTASTTPRPDTRPLNVQPGATPYGHKPILPSERTSAADARTTKPRQPAPTPTPAPQPSLSSAQPSCPPTSNTPTNHVPPSPSAGDQQHAPANSAGSTGNANTAPR